MLPMETFNIVVLSLSGLLIFIVGAMRLSHPIYTYGKAPGITLDDEVNLLSELRGLGAVMMGAGAIVLAGPWVPQLTPSSFVVGSLIFVGFALARILGIAVDGKPNNIVMKGLVTEVVFGCAHLFGVFSAFG